MGDADIADKKKHEISIMTGKSKAMAEHSEKLR
jgi:hypothetical protein